MDDNKHGSLLGQNTPVLQEYAPHILDPIPRVFGRESLGLTGTLPFHGVDQWHAYEMSWLDDNGKPVARVGRFSIPATSPNIVESKSFKLYLNSLNNTRFSSDADALALITADIGAAAGERIGLTLFTVDDPALAGFTLDGECLDDLPVTVSRGEPTAAQLKVGAGPHIEEVLYSHLLRSLCPVTGQPDWATVRFHYSGSAIDKSALLQYIIAYREHQEFHEQCVERMFCDLMSHTGLAFLHIQAFYTRRGGLDINPFRSTDAHAKPLPRLDRQ